MCKHFEKKIWVIVNKYKDVNVGSCVGKKYVAGYYNNSVNNIYFGRKNQRHRSYIICLRTTNELRRKNTLFTHFEQRPSILEELSFDLAKLKAKDASFFYIFASQNANCKKSFFQNFSGNP